MDISTATSTISACFTLASAISKERDRLKLAELEISLKTKLAEIQTQLLDVLQAAAVMQGELTAAKQRLAEMEAQKADRDRYALVRVGTVGQFFAYQLRPADELRDQFEEPAHLVCQPCFEVGKKAVLHITDHFAECPVCRVKAQIAPWKRYSAGEPPVWPNGGY